jgi:hypothetical protein
MALLPAATGFRKKSPVPIKSKVKRYSRHFTRALPLVNQ